MCVCPQAPPNIQITSFFSWVGFATVDGRFRANPTRAGRCKEADAVEIGRENRFHAQTFFSGVPSTIASYLSSSVRFSISTRGRDSVGWEHVAF